MKSKIILALFLFLGLCGYVYRNELSNYYTNELVHDKIFPPGNTFQVEDFFDENKKDDLLGIENYLNLNLNCNSEDYKTAIFLSMVTSCGVDDTSKTEIENIIIHNTFDLKKNENILLRISSQSNTFQKDSTFTYLGKKFKPTFRHRHSWKLNNEMESGFYLTENDNDASRRLIACGNPSQNLNEVFSNNEFEIMGKIKWTKEMKLACRYKVNHHVVLFFKEDSTKINENLIKKKVLKDIENQKIIANHHFGGLFFNYSK